MPTYWVPLPSELALLFRPVLPPWWLRHLRILWLCIASRTIVVFGIKMTWKIITFLSYTYFSIENLLICFTFLALLTHCVTCSCLQERSDSINNNLRFFAIDVCLTRRKEINNPLPVAWQMNVITCCHHTKARKLSWAHWLHDADNGAHSVSTASSRGDMNKTGLLCTLA